MLAHAVLLHGATSERLAAQQAGMRHRAGLGVRLWIGRQVVERDNGRLWRQQSGPGQRTDKGSQARLGVLS